MTYSQKITTITKSDDNLSAINEFPVFDSDVYKEAWSLTFAAIAKGAKSLINAVVK
jgi:hypothetical protein